MLLRCYLVVLYLGKVEVEMIGGERESLSCSPRATPELSSISSG